MKKLNLLILTLVGILVFLFWWLWHPELLNYHEQNQLFLTTSSYLAERLSVAGGLADWLSEAIVACYALPWLGALLLAVLFMVLLACTQALLVGTRALYRSPAVKPEQQHLLASCLSLLTLPLLLWLLGDINVLLAYPVALLMVLVTFNVMRRASLLWDVLVLPLLYWFAGPLVWFYVVLRIIAVWQQPREDRRVGQTLPARRMPRWLVFLEPLFLLALQLLAYRFVLTQWPLQAVLLGLNYYRIPLHGNWLMVIIPVVIVVLAAVCGVGNATRQTMNAKPAGMKSAVSPSRRTKTAIAITVVTVLALSACAVHFGYNRDICETLRQDMLVRNGQWQEVIQRAEHYQPHTAFSSNSVNLALAMTRQLADRQFEFYQSGDDALLSPSIRDNMSDLPTMEAFYQLGLVNSSLRYAHDIEESILNYRKSGRLEQRIVECNVIDGRYDLARKHLDLLKQSPFYRSWALDMEQTMQKETFIMASPLGDIRRRRFKDDFLFSYDEVDKVLGQLFVNNPQNKMALDYFMGSMLLRGNIQGFVQYMSWVQQYGGYSQMPVGYQDAMRAIQSHGQAPGAYTNYVRKSLSSDPSPSRFAREGE